MIDIESGRRFPTSLIDQLVKVVLTRMMVLALIDADGLVGGGGDIRIA
jgi:hypothetical protein